jgi:hypothetical protein
MCASSSNMTHRTHFWLRLVGLTLILAAEFGPRVWSSMASGNPVPAQASVASASLAR